MAKVNNLKRINIEDFPSEYQDLISQLAFSLNPMLEQISSAFDKKIDFDNLNQEVSVIETEVDTFNIPKVKLEIKVNLKTRLRGTEVISVFNLSDTTLLVGAPFVEYDLVAGGLRVKKITGLVPDKKYRVTILLIG